MTTIILKNSNAAGLIPSVNELELGELAVNTHDGKLFVKKQIGNAVSIVEVTGGGGTSIVAESNVNPVAFMHADISSVAVGGLVNSNTVTVSGLIDGETADFWTSASFAVGTSGVYIDGVLTTATIASPAQVSNGMEIYLRNEVSSDGAGGKYITSTHGMIGDKPFVWNTMLPSSGIVDYTFDNVTIPDFNNAPVSSTVILGPYKIEGIATGTVHPWVKAGKDVLFAFVSAPVADPSTLTITDTVNTLPGGSGYLYLKVTTGTLYSTARKFYVAFADGQLLDFTVTTAPVPQVFDTTPNSFSFTPIINAPQSTLLTSNTITLIGVSPLVDIPTTFSGSGEYQLNTDAWTSVTGASINMQLGDTLTLRHTTSASYTTGTSTNVVIGGVSGAFTSTTQAADNTPDNFSFVDLNNHALGNGTDYQNSNTITIAGITEPVSVSVSGGEYQINSGTFTSTVGSITSGDTLTVQTLIPTSNSSTSTVTVTVGSLIRSFTVATVGSDVTPDQVTFNAVTNASLNSVYNSNVVTVSGMSAGTTNGAYVTFGSMSVNGATFTTSTVQVQNGDTIQIRITSSNSNSSSLTSYLVIGTMSAPYVVTTLAADTTPDAFSFSATGNATLSTSYNSSSITVAGLGSGVSSSFSVTGGTAKKNGGTAVSSGSVVNGDTIVLVRTSSSSYSAALTTTLTIGGVSATWTLTTQAADTTPDAFTFGGAANLATGGTNTTGANTFVSGCSPGVNIPISVTGTGAESSVQGGAFSSTAKTIQNGQYFNLRQPVPTTRGASSSITCTIGGVSATRTVSTSPTVGKTGTGNYGRVALHSTSQQSFAGTILFPSAFLHQLDVASVGFSVTGANVINGFATYTSGDATGVNFTAYYQQSNPNSTSTVTVTVAATGY